VWLMVAPSNVNTTAARPRKALTNQAYSCPLQSWVHEVLQSLPMQAMQALASSPDAGTDCQHQHQQLDTPQSTTHLARPSPTPQLYLSASFQPTRTLRCCGSCIHILTIMLCLHHHHRPRSLSACLNRPPLTTSQSGVTLSRPASGST